MITNEKRAFKRVKHKFTVIFSKHGDRSHKGMSVTENISLGGVYFSSLEAFGIGELLDCRIEAGPAGTILRTGRVVRCEKLGKQMLPSFGVAIEFANTPGDAEQKLKSLL